MAQQQLPAGWRVVNASGSSEGPKVTDEELDEITEDLEASGIDIRPDSPGWEDVNAEDDEMALVITSLFDNQTFSSVENVIAHDKEKHGFDLLAVQSQHHLDFLETMKLINYVRQAVIDGNTKPDTSKPELWKDDKFLKPVLEDDPLLYSIDDVIEFDEPEAEESVEQAAPV